MISYTLQVLAHKFWVLWNVLGFAARLVWRGITHDLSRFRKPERGEFAQLLPQVINTAQPSSDEMRVFVEKEVALQHHYAHNRHHPQHFVDGIRGMTLVDLVEMWCDWKASLPHHRKGGLPDLIDANQERFEYCDDLAAILHNSISSTRTPTSGEVQEPARETNDDPDPEALAADLVNETAAPDEREFKSEPASSNK